MSDNIVIFGGVSAVERLTFTKHLSIMLKSGIPLAESIEIVSRQNNNVYFRKVLHKIREEVVNGQEFDKALSFYPKFFDPFYVQLIKVGEQSGNLEKNLDYLATHLRKTHEFSQKIKSALLYPTIVLLVAFTAAIGLSIFVLPKLVDLFNSLDVELPITTRILLWFANVMNNYGIYIFAFLGICVIAFKVTISQKFAKPLWHRFLLSLPVIGSFIQNVQLASICRNMGTLLQSSIPITRALEIQKESTQNMIFREYIDRIQKGVERGKTLESIFDHSKFNFFPLIAVRMLGVGEKTGKLDETFSYLGDYFEDEVDSTSKNLSTILEPVILIIVGLIVAFIAVSIIGPIYQFSSSIKR